MDKFVIKEEGTNDSDYYVVAEEIGKEVIISGYSAENVWTNIFRYLNHSEQFIEEYSNKVDWEVICETQKLSEKFIEQHQNELDWEYVSAYQTLSEKFINTHRDKISIKYLAENKNAEIPEDMKVLLKMRGLVND